MRKDINRAHVACLQVDNVILRDPPMQRSPLFVGLDLTPLLQPQQQPCPGGYFQPLTLQMPKPMEALLRTQGAAPEQEESLDAQSTAQHAEQAQNGSALQQLSDILRRDAQGLQVCWQAQGVMHCHVWHACVRISQIGA